jgi:hypothetical protein
VTTDPNTGNDSSVAMNSLPTNLAAFYLQQLTKWQTAVTTLNTLYENLAASTLDEYNLGSGDGRVMGKRKDLTKVGNELGYAEERYGYYYKKLYGRGLMTLRTRRKP